MASYNKKDTVALAFEANKKRIRNEMAIVAAEVLNEALAEMTDQFTEALSRGEVLSIEGSREEMRRFLRAAADKTLGGGTKHALPGKK